MTPTPPSDFSISFSEVEWLRFMTSEKRRPNVLVSCSNSGVGPVVARLTSVCGRPLHSRHLPAPLNLQEVTSGTLLLWDVAQMTLEQQMELHEWMGGTPAGCPGHLGDGLPAGRSGGIGAVLRRVVLPAERDHASGLRGRRSRGRPARHPAVPNATFGARLRAALRQSIGV